MTCKDHSATVNTASTSPNECLCLKGFQVSGGSNDDSCEQCPQGQYKIANGNSACQTCPAGSTTIDMQAFDVTHCVARPGFSKHAETSLFTACPKGFYKASTGNEACQACSAHHTTTGTGAQSVSDCRCESPKYVTTGSNVCGCSPGYYFTNDACELCEVGMICIGSGTRTLAATVATTCPAHSTVQIQGASSIADCECEPGYYPVAEGASEFRRLLLTGSEVCTQCPFDTYKQTISNGACTTCGTNAFSEAGSDELSDCKCDIDHYGVN